MSVTVQIRVNKKLTFPLIHLQYTVKMNCKILVNKILLSLACPKQKGEI